MDDVIARASVESARLGHNYIGTEHVLLAIVNEDPALLAPYDVTRVKLVQAITTELLRIFVELQAARSIVESVRRAAEQHEGIQLPPRQAPLHVTPRVATILDQTRSTSPHDVLAAILDEDSNLAVIVLDRLGVPLDELRRQLD